MIINVGFPELKILMLVTILATGCAPTMEMITLKEPEPEFRGCLQINPNQSFHQVMTCESDDSYFFYIAEKPWLHFPKREYQKYIRTILHTYLLAHNIEPIKIQAKKIELWVGSEIWDARKSRLYAYVHPLIFQLHIVPSPDQIIGADVSQIPKKFEKKFPEYLGVAAGKIDLELKNLDSFSNFQHALFQSQPEVKIAFRDKMMVRLEVPEFKLDHWAHLLIQNPQTSRFIKHLRFVNPSLKTRHYRLFTSFPF